MKNLWKKILPAMVLAMALCVGAIAMSACGKKDVVFKDSQPTMGGMQTDMVLTLKTDGTAVCDVTIPGMPADNQLQTMMDSEGTWTLKDNVYTVTLGEGDKAVTMTSTYDKETKKHTIVYKLRGPEKSFDFTLEQQD